MPTDLTRWLLECDEPWTRYRTLVNLLNRGEDDSEVRAARHEMLAHPGVQDVIARAATWPGRPLKRHNDASHPIYAFSTLADFGVQAGDPGMDVAIEAIVAHQAPEGPFQTLVNIPRAFGGTDEDMWTWMVCDAPTLLYSLAAIGLADDPRVRKAAQHLTELVDDNGWRCVAAAELGKFRGPGRKADPCPIANVYALKALSLLPDLAESEATQRGADVLLWHWEHQRERKIYMFGIGTDFRKLKYPFVWYDILHVMDVLSRFPFVRTDRRFRDMVDTMTSQANEEGRYTAKSMYRAWKGWSFADKKKPSPWITFLVLRVLRRMEQTM